MDERKNILLVCAAGYATTSMMKTRIEDGLSDLKIDSSKFEIQTATISSINNYIEGADLIVTTLSLDEEEYNVPIINGIQLLTGMMTEDVMKKIIDALALSV